MGLGACCTPIAGADSSSWGFEQVTPSDKGAGAVNAFDTFRPSPDGNALLYSTTAPLDGVATESAPLYVRYLGTRGTNGWSSRGLDVLSGVSTTFYIMSVVGSSADVSHALVTSQRALAPGATPGGSNVYMRDTRTGALTLVATAASPDLTNELSRPAGALQVQFVASDGRSALFTSSVPLLPGAATFSVYSWTADRGLRTESVLPADEGGASVGGASAGDSETGGRDTMPQDDALKHVYFTRYDNNFGAAYVRTNGATKAISVSHLPGAPSTPVRARVDAVGAGGRFALFHALDGDRLTADTPTDLVNTVPLYRYDVSDDSLTYVGATDSIGVGVIQMSGDGRSVAFQSQDPLDADGVVGQLNTYVWRDGHLRFVAAAETGFPSSTATDAGRFLRLLSPNGRYLSFTDNTAATAQRFGYDNLSDRCPVPFLGGAGGCDQVYLFDADTGELSCASCQPGAGPPRGNSGDPGNSVPGYVRMDRHQMQTVTDDGTVLFTSPDDLVREDSNGTNDVYASRGGQLRLVSRAKQGTSARLVDATPDGKTIFIATNDPIAPTDDDQAVDIYMTREGAGFPYTAPDVPPSCSGGDCRAPFSPPAAPSSAATDQPGLSDVNPKAPAAPKVTTRVGSAVLRGAKLRLSIRTSSGGRIRASGAGLRATTRTVKGAGTYVVSVALTKKTQIKLRKQRKLATRVRVSLTPPFGRAAITTYRRTLRK